MGNQDSKAEALLSELNVEPGGYRLSKKEDNTSMIKQIVDHLSQLVTGQCRSQQRPNSRSKRKEASPKASQSIAPVEPRDQTVLVELPESIQSEELLTWVGEVCSQVVSSAFYFFNTEQLQFEQAKVFCAERILEKIALLTLQFELEPDDMKRINIFLSKNVMPFLKLKYPMTESKTVNKALAKRIKQNDLSDEYDNNFIFQSSVMFKSRRSGNYNDLIMRFVNEVLVQVDKEKSAIENGETNFQAFESQMTKLFQTVEVYPQKIKKNPTEQQAEEYREKVRDYTHYLIGRKVEKDVELFSEAEIMNEDLKIKSGSILRILVKWCEELRSKFDTNNYFLDNLKNIKTQGMVEQKVAIKSQIEKLQTAVEQEKFKIQQFLNQLIKNSYDMESVLLRQELQAKDGHFEMPAVEKACGKFSMKVIKLLHNYVVQYLNRLIHGLLIVSEGSFEQIDSVSPCLLSFTLGDIMRCKCTSKQTEILSLYEGINKLEKEDKLKIVRLKNRLANETRDILINFKFGGVLCEIQLAVSSTLSNKFFENSNSFNHFLYEIERSPFGAIMELCSVLKAYDKKAKAYDNIIKEQEKTVKSSHYHSHACPNNPKLEIFMNEDMPFVCSSCKILFTHSNFVVPHKKCRSCQSYWKCAVCQIFEDSCSSEKPLLASLFQKANNKIEYSHLSYRRSLCQFGACVYINKKTVNVEPFQLRRQSHRTLLFSRPIGEERASLIKDVTTSQSLDDFLANYIILTPSKKYLQVSKKKKQTGILPFVRKHIFTEEINLTIKKQKNKFYFNERGISDEELKEMIALLKEKDYVNKTTTLKLLGNNLTDVSLICEELSSMECLDISQNKRIQEYKSLEKLTKLKELQLNSNAVKIIPLQILSFKQLTRLDLNYNGIDTIPKEIGFLKDLTYLSIFSNEIKLLPAGLFTLKNLKVLYLSNNKLTELPVDFRELTKLEDLRFAGNQIKSVSSIAGLSCLKIITGRANLIEELPDLSALQNLEEFWFQNNSIQSLPTSFKQTPCLRKLTLFKNKFQPKAMLSLPPLLNLKFLDISDSLVDCLPKELEFFSSLQTLRAVKNKISEIPTVIGRLKNIKVINLGENIITSLPATLCLLQKLTHLDVSSNKLQNIPEEIAQLISLEYVSLEKNQIVSIPRQIKFCAKIQILYLSHNKIKIVPKELEQLTRLGKGQLWLSNQFLILDGNPIKVIECQDFVVVAGDQYTSKYVVDWKKTQIVNSVTQENDPYDSSLTSLESLDLSKLKSGVPDDFSRLTALKELSLADIGLMAIPPSIYVLHSLYKLDISRNKIKNLPPQLSSLSRLQILIASHNDFSDEASLNVLSSFRLRILALAECKIFKLPSTLSSVTTLKTFDLTGNKDMKSYEVAPLLSLEVVSLSHFSLEKIPSFLWEWKVVRKLYLGGVGVGQISEKISLLTSLQVFKFPDNPIVRIPKQIMQLKKLRFLCLSNCKLEDEEVDKLKELHDSLTQLDLSSNNITDITFVCNLIKLRMLDLQKNAIHYVPLKLNQLTQLEMGELYLDGNPLTAVHCSDFVLRMRPIFTANERKKFDQKKANKNEMEDEDYA